MAEILFCGTILAAQPAEGVSPPSGPASLVEDRLEAVRKAPTDPLARLELGVAYGQAEENDLAMAGLEGAGRVDEAIAQYELYLQSLQSASGADEHSVEAITQRLAKLKERRTM